MPRDDDILPGRWTQKRRDVAVCVWVAFLAASVGTLFVFALLDPEDIHFAWASDWHPGRRLAYTLGFFSLFGITLLTSGITAYMIRTGPKTGHARGRGRRKPPEIHAPEKDNPDLDIEDLK